MVCDGRDMAALTGESDPQRVLRAQGADHEAPRQDTYRHRRCVGVLGLVGGLVAAGLAAGPVRITVDGADMTVHFSLPDKVLAVHGDVRVPLASIRKISVVNQP
jgi:hypothetical protein